MSPKKNKASCYKAKLQTATNVISFGIDQQNIAINI